MCLINTESQVYPGWFKCFSYESNPLTFTFVSAIKAPSQLAVEFKGYYDTVTCTKDNQQSVKDTLETRLIQLDCIKSGSCAAAIQPNSCESDRRKRDTTGNGMTMSVSIETEVTSSDGTINLMEVLQNNSGTQTSFNLQFHFTRPHSFPLPNNVI